MKIPKGAKSRTVWMGYTISALGLAQTFATDFPIRPLYQGLFALIVGLLIVLLRYDSHDSIADK